ncbi:unnamed protein product, partial [Rotaria sp. Silwood1]
VPDRKRPYNVSVDPARYRRVPDPDDATAGNININIQVIRIRTLTVK